LFTYLVHENPKLADTLKFHLLRTHLKGTAFDTIKGYAFEGANYMLAWGDLKRRFGRKDELIQEYIRKFLETPAITQRASFIKLRAIVDSTNQMLRALPSLAVDVSSWDPFVMLILTMKLDEETRNEWKQRKGRREADVKEMLEFIENRALELQPTQADRLSQLLKGERKSDRRPAARVFQINNETECPLCKGPHKIWHCPKLKSECAKVRTNIIKSLKLCFKCLLKHELGACKKDCPYCGGPHNLLLCYKKENDNKNRKTGVRPKTKPIVQDDWDDWDKEEQEKNSKN